MYPRLKDLREDKGLTQKQVADYLHCTQQAYSAYETGKREIPITHLKVLSKLYEKSIDYLLENPLEEK